MKFIKINCLDNVLVTLTAIDKNEVIGIDGLEIVVLQDIPMGHKICTTQIKKGESVIKYGLPIGSASSDIKPGEWVHTHNVKTNLSDVIEYKYEPENIDFEKTKSTTFKGYKRDNGSVGVRNEIWIIPTVGCVNSSVEIIEKKVQHLVKENIDGIYSFKHPYGCSQLGQDHENTKQALAGLVNHPNAGAVLVLGLGCENNGIEDFKKSLGNYDRNRIKFLVSQDCEDEIMESIKFVEELADYASQFKRIDCEMSSLVIGLKCGGSDGLSGITANPLVGAFSDRLISEGGSSILTEVPEMFGAEIILMNRCTTQVEYEKTVSLINDFKEYFKKYDQVIYENPSPGNKAGGITTLEDKSLGCTQKGGAAPVVDVLKYTEPVVKNGLNLLCSPGNDLVASTALAISGAQIVLFTTGRGTPFGSPVPTVKISSNTELFIKKKSWIDFDAGRLVSGSTVEDVANEFYEYIRKLASGEVLCKAEQYGKKDLAIFKDGVTL